MVSLRYGWNQELKLWSELSLSSVHSAFLWVGVTLRQAFPIWVPPKLPGLCLPYTYPSGWKKSFSLCLVPMKVLELGFLGLIHWPIMEASPVECGGKTCIPSHEWDMGVHVAPSELPE